jgi:hypothetical protein
VCHRLPAVSLEDARAAAETYSRGSRAASTWRAYESDWKTFNVWRRSVDPPALPATSATVALFVAAQATLGLAPATLDRRLAAIRLMHLGAKLPSPHDSLDVAEVMRGIRRAWMSSCAVICLPCKSGKSQRAGVPASCGSICRDRSPWDMICPPRIQANVDAG